MRRLKDEIVTTGHRDHIAEMRESIQAAGNTPHRVSSVTLERSLHSEMNISQPVSEISSGTSGMSSESGKGGMSRVENLLSRVNGALHGSPESWAGTVQIDRFNRPLGRSRPPYLSSPNPRDRDVSLNKVANERYARLSESNKIGGYDGVVTGHDGVTERQVEAMREHFKKCARRSYPTWSKVNTSGVETEKHKESVAVKGELSLLCTNLVYKLDLEPVTVQEMERRIKSLKIDTNESRIQEADFVNWFAREFVMAQDQFSNTGKNVYQGDAIWERSSAIATKALCDVGLDPGAFVVNQPPPWAHS